MSDRVRFLTVNDTVSPTASSGCNGFPFPFITVPDNPLHYPIATTRKKAMDWWWRVEKWKAETDFVVTQAGSLHTQTATFGGDSPAALAMERDLIAPTASHQGSWDAQGAGGGSVNGFVIFEVFGMGASGAVLRDGDVFKPRIDFYSPGITAFDESAGQPLGPGSSELRFAIEGFGGGADGTVDVSLDGLVFPVEYKFFGPIGGGVGSYSGSFIDITPARYWPYAGKDGLPIYDTTTGELLPGRDPTM